MGIFRNFPYTNFHEMNLDWLLNTMKELKASWDSFTVNWQKEIQENIYNWLDLHPEATTTVQDGSLTEAKFTNELKLKTLKEYITPEMCGAVGDGITDDTEALQTMLNDGRTCYVPSKTYAISSPLYITKDTTVLCDVKATFKPIYDMEYMLICGETVEPSGSSLLDNIIKVIWDGGYFECYNTFIAQSGIKIEKLHHSQFSNISINNVTEYGMHWSGAYGADAFADNVVVRGRPAIIATGFNINRMDQRLTNCTAIDCVIGFNIPSGGITLERCSAWVSVDTNWNDTVFAEITGNNVKISNCTVDTMKTGFIMGYYALYTVISNCNVICNTAIVADYTGTVLLKPKTSISGIATMLLIGFYSDLDTDKFSILASNYPYRVLKYVDKGYRVSSIDEITNIDDYKETGNYCAKVRVPSVYVGWALIDVAKVIDSLIMQSIRLMVEDNERTRTILRKFDGTNWHTVYSSNIDTMSLSSGNQTSLDDVIESGMWFRYCTVGTGITNAGWYLIINIPSSNTIICQLLIGIDNNHTTSRMTTDGGTTWSAWVER